MRRHAHSHPSASPRFGALLTPVLIFCAVLGALVLFGMLAEDVAEGEVLSFDLPVQMWLRAWSNGPLDQAMRAVTMLGSAMVTLPLLAIVAWRHRRQPAAIGYLLAANLGAMLLNLGAKQFFGRARPTDWTPLVDASSYSFPSGHAMHSMALACSLLLLVARPAHIRYWLGVALLYVAAVGASRIYLGVHYPSDVLAGWCASFVWCAGLFASMRVKRRVSVAPA